MKANKDSELSVYRAPADGLVLAEPIVPLDPWRCRLLGHSLVGRYERVPINYREEQLAREGTRLFAVVCFPSNDVPSRLFETVWCSRCSREWRRKER